MNKAMLFYYFNTKENLYHAAVSRRIGGFAMAMQKELTGMKSGLPTIERLVDAHIRFLRSSSDMVTFLVRELASSREKLSPLLAESFKPVKGVLPLLVRSIRSAQDRGEIRPVDPYQTVLSIIALDLFSILAEPVAGVLFPGECMESFREKRIESVIDLLFNGLRTGKEESL